MDIYEFFAEIYDEIIPESFYLGYATFIDEIIRINNIARHKVLDIGCGTGRMLSHLDFLKKTGVDLSINMLERAKKRLDSSFNGIQANMLSIPSNDLFDLIICTNDSINYLQSIDEIQIFFTKIFCLLKENGCFIFDINTMAFYERMKDKTIIKEFKFNDRVLYWKDIFREDSNIIELTLYSCMDENDNLFSRKQEIHRQYRFNECDVLEMVRKQINPSNIEIYGRCFKKTSDHTDNKIYIVIFK